MNIIQRARGMKLRIDDYQSIAGRKIERASMHAFLHDLDQELRWCFVKMLARLKLKILHPFPHPPTSIFQTNSFPLVFLQNPSVRGIRGKCSVVISAIQPRKKLKGKVILVSLRILVGSQQDKKPAWPLISSFAPATQCLLAWLARCIKQCSACTELPPVESIRPPLSTTQQNFRMINTQCMLCSSQEVQQKLSVFPVE